MKCRSRAPVRWVRDEQLPTLEELAWLTSPPGRSACAAMAAGEPADTPAAIDRWRQRLPPEQVAAAWMQVTLRTAARAKFARADEMLLDRVGLQQATDEVVAAYKARRFVGVSRVADLCCGIGGDALALAGQSEVVAVDWSAVRVAMAEHNAAVYGHPIKGVSGDVTFDRPGADAAHIDPDRRSGGSDGRRAGGRRHQPEACSPGLDVLERVVHHYAHVAIKLSPGADFETLPFDAEIELISHQGECKQAVVWTGRFKQTHRRATVLPSGESVSAAKPECLTWPPPRPPTPGCVLFEPDPAVIRANLVGPVAQMHHLSPIDEQIACLVGDQPIATSLLKAFRVTDVIPWSAKQARRWLAQHDIGRVDIKTRGFAARPEEILRRLRPAGKRHGVLFLTRIKNKPVAILAERLAA